MAHKTLTISEESYNAMTELKREGESFSKLFLRLARNGSARNLLEYVEGRRANEDLASSIERVYKKRQKTKFREVDL